MIFLAALANAKIMKLLIFFYPTSMRVRGSITVRIAQSTFHQVPEKDMAVERVVPALIDELKLTKSDLSTIGNRFLTMLETYWGPQLKKVQPKRIISEFQAFFIVLGFSFMQLRLDAFTDFNQLLKLA
jgi:hypothetical protein